MWDVFARLRVVALGLGVLAAGSVVEASVISFKAVKKNDEAITPTNNLAVVGNDKIEVEMFLSNWALDFPIDGTPNNVRAFQVAIDRLGYVSNDNGSAKPLGWCGPVDQIACTQSATCPPEYPNCLTSPSTGCTCSPHNPVLGGFITATRSDFLLFGHDGPAPGVDTSFINYRYYGVLTSGSVPDTTPSVPRYLGTLILKVSANSCGTFTFGFVREIESTFITEPATFKPISSLPTLTPLTLTVSDCSRQLLSCNPGHCSVDARIAHNRLNYDQKFNASQMVMTFSKSTTSPNMTAADFEVTVVPYAPDDEDNDIRTIIAITPNGADPKITTLTLNRRIRQTRWTCIRDKGSNKRCCMGSLPADADNNRISQLDDTFEVFENLQGIVSPALAIEKCDTDRGGSLTAPPLCSPADLLMVVDLLNGADAFALDSPPTRGVNGDSLPALVPACNSMNLPP